MAEVQDPIKRKKLYDYLAKNQMTDLDFDTFSREYATNPEKTNKLYSYLKSNNMTDLDENSFKTEYFGDVKKKDDSSPTSQNQELVSESEDTSLVTPQSETTPQTFGHTTLEDLQKAELETLQSQPQQNLFPYIEDYNQATSITPDDEQLAREEADRKLSGTFLESLESGYKKFANFTTRVATLGISGRDTSVETYADKQRGKAFDSLLKKGVPLNEIPEQIENETKELAYKEELSKIKDQKVTDYLSNLPEEQKQELEYEKINSYKGLVDEEKSLVLQYTIDSKKAQELNSQLQNTKNRIDLTAGAIQKLQDEGKEVPEDLMNHYDEAVELFNSRREELIGLGESYKNFGEKLQENFDKQIEEEEAIDLIKRNYDFVDNMKATFASAYSRTFIEGGMGIAAYYEYIKGNPALATLYSLQAREQSKLTEDVMGEYRKPMEYDEVNSMNDLGYFISQSTIEQVPIMMLLAAPGGAGISALGGSSTGQKFAEMQEKNITGQEEYNPFQMISAPALEGGFEAGLGALPTYGILKRTLGNTSRRTLFSQGVGGAIKQTGKDLGIEISTEMATEIGQNWTNMTVLGDKSVNLTDNIDHAGFKTLASMPVFLLGGRAFSSLTKQFSPKADIDELTENLLKITELQQSLESATSESAKSTIQKSILELEQKNDAVFKKVRDDMSNMDKATYNRVNAITKRQAELRANADAIKNDGGIPAGQKQRLLSEMSKEFNALEDTRESLVSGNAQLADRLPPDQVIELKDQAQRQLVAEAEARGETEYSFNDQQITKKAIEIYNAETAEQAQEQKTQTSTPVINTEAEAQAGEYFTRDIGGDMVVYRRNEDGTASILPDSEAQNILSQPTIDAEIQTETTPTIEETQTANETTPTTDTETDGGVRPRTDGVQQQGTKTDIQPAVEPETSPTETKIKLGKTDRATEFTVRRNEAGNIEVLKPDGTPEINQRNNILLEYAKQQNFTEGEQANSRDLTESSNPAEVAEGIASFNINTMLDEGISHVTNVLADIIGTVSRSSFLRFGDRNTITQTIGKAYLRNDGRAIDDIAQEASEIAGVEVTPQDVVDFILEFPNGPQEVRTKLRAENLIPLQNRFTELTGLPANPNIIQEAVRQKRLQEERNANLTSLDLMTDEQLTQLYNESRQAEQQEIEQLREGTDETQDSPDSQQQPTVQEQSGEATKVDLAKDLKLDDAISIIDKYLSEVDKFGKETFGMNFPVAVAKTVLNAMKIAAKTAKTTADIISEGVNALKKTDWYKNLTKGEQKDVSDNFEVYINRPFKTNPEKTRLEIDQDVDVAQGISADTSNQRDTTLSDAGPVKNKARRQNIFRRFWNNTFMSDQGAPKKLANIVRSLIGERSAYTDMLAYEVGAYNKILNKVKGRTKKSYNEAALAINDYLMGNENADVSFLTPQEREQIDYFRERVDSLSDKLVRNLEIALERAESKKQEETAERIKTLIETIKGNKGSYLHRTYEAFTNENYLEELTSANPNKSAKDRIQKAVEYIMAENDVTEQEARRQLFEYLDGLKNQGDFVTASANGRAKAPFLKKRQEIPVEIRELLGETKDPIVNYVNTVFKISDYISTLEYQQRLGDYLYDTGIGTTEAKEGYTRLVPQSEGWQILSDIFVPIEIKQAIEDLQPLQTINSSFYRNWVKIAAITKLGKTVLSATTTMRNILSGTFLGLNAGFFFASNPKRMVTAFQQAFGTKKTQTELLEERQKMIKMGVLNDGAVSGEILATMNDFSKTPDRMIKKSLLEKGLHVAQMVYKFGDDFYKVIGYYHFKSLYQKNGFTEAEAEAKAAERITQTFPTYSRIPRNIQKLRRLPVIGSFPSFAWEVWRTTKNAIEYIGEDIAEKRYGMAARQAAGTAVAYSAAYGLSVFTKSLYGIDDDEDDFIRDGSPEWQRNSLLIYTGKEDGKPTFLDATALFPSETILKPIRTLFEERQGRNVGKKLTETSKELFGPFLDLDISFKVVMNVLSNKDDNGKEIAQGETLLERAINHPDKLADYITKKAGPGTYNNIIEFARANDIAPEFFGDRMTAYGREYNNRDALLAVLGLRFSTINYNSVLMNRGYQEKDKHNYVRSEINRKLKTTNVLSEEKIEGLFREYQKANKETSESLIVGIRAARKFGVPEGDIETALKLSGFAKKDIINLQFGVEPKLKPVAKQTVTRREDLIRLNYSEELKAQEVVENYKKNIDYFNYLIDKANMGIEKED